MQACSVLKDGSTATISPSGSSSKGDDVPYTTPQYRTLSHLCALLMERWPAIGPDRLVGHCDIAPGRKTDPGPAFDWTRFHREVLALTRCSVTR